MKTIPELLESYGEIPFSEKMKRLQADLKDAKGLGDAIAAGTRLAGIEPCGGCKERQEFLNRAVPFK